MSRASPYRTRTSFSIIHIWISCCFPHHFCSGCYPISHSVSVHLLPVADWSSGSAYGRPTDEAHAYIQHVYVLNKLFRIFYFRFLFTFCEITFEFEKYEMLSFEMWIVRDWKSYTPHKVDPENATIYPIRFVRCSVCLREIGWNHEKN